MIRSPDIENLKIACELLTEGDIIGLPTETVYGLAADATQTQAVLRIYQAKNRPTFNPLIAHVANYEEAKKWGQFTPLAELFANIFWRPYPHTRPLTLVVQQTNNKLSDLVTAGLSTLAIRIPCHPVALELLHLYKKPLAAPSANRSNTISPTSAQDVEDSLKDKVSLILDGGPCQVGLESTILDVTGDKPILLRPGGVTCEEILEKTGFQVELSSSNKILAPGMLKKHYAPNLPLRLNALSPLPHEAFLGFGNICENSTLNLSPQGDLKEAASNLFRMLKALDTPPYQGICVAPIPQEGLGYAINDRLNRAASL